MILFSVGIPFAPNNNAANGIQFLNGQAHPILGDWVETLPQSQWWAG